MLWALFEPEFLIIWRMSFLEKQQLANKFSISKVDTFVRKIELKISLFFWSTMYLLKTLLL